MTILGSEKCLLKGFWSLKIVYVNFAHVFFVFPICIHKKLDMAISYVLHEYTKILYLFILLVYMSYVLHESTKIFYLSIIQVHFLYVLHEYTRPLCVYILYVHLRMEFDSGIGPTCLYL